MMIDCPRENYGQCLVLNCYYWLNKGRFDNLHETTLSSKVVKM